MGDGEEEGLRGGSGRGSSLPERGFAQERPRASLDIRIRSPQEGLFHHHHHHQKEPGLCGEGAAGRSPGDRQASVWGTVPSHRRPWLPLGHASWGASALRPPGQVSTTCPVSTVGLLPLLPTPTPVRPREDRECKLHDCQEGNSYSFRDRKSTRLNSSHT